MQSSDPAARELLQAMIERYRKTTAYSDDARVRLAYRQAGRKHVDEAPLSVVWERGGKLHLRAYAAELVAQGGRIQATITDPLTENMDGQRLDRPLAEKTLGLADIYADPTLTHFATAGLGGPAPQLELLLSEKPLEGLFDDSTVLRLDRTAAAGNPYDALVIQTDGLVYTLWIERETLLLRRVDLPAEATGLTANPGLSDIRLTIELPAASFSVPASENWQLGDPPPRAAPGAPPAPGNELAGDAAAGERPDDRGSVVTAFVPPPPPLVSPYLGRQLPDFEFVDGDGAAVVTEEGSDRDFMVMLWIADHPASQMAAQQLQSVADDLPASLSDRTRFVLVMAEASADAPEATGQMLRRWTVGLPYVDDVQAVGRDVFNVREAPTLCVLGGEGVMHWFQPRVGPDLAAQLPKLLGDLEEGKDVGGELRKRYEEDQQTYKKLLAEAMKGP